MSLLGLYSRVCCRPHPVWLSPPVAARGEEPAYREGKRVIEGLKVTNDVVERGAKLIKDLLNSVTVGGGRLQLLHVGEKYRKEVTDFCEPFLASSSEDSTVGWGESTILHIWLQKDEYSCFQVL